MGFPTPLSEWVDGEANEFVRDIFSSRAALNRELIDNRKVLIGLSKEVKYGRKIWGMLCLELWQQEFHDKENAYKQLMNGEGGL
jgi:asparagine synthase (glutamine-hydrolysing)